MPINSIGNSGLGVAGLTGGGLSGKGLAGGGGGMSLRSPGFLRGRQNVAIPNGLVLAEATGGVEPYTYTCTDLPGGVTFTTGTRTLSGTPSANGDFTPTYTATDADGTAVARTFNWSVLDLLSNAHIALQDFDSGRVGYGISTFDFAYAVVLESGADPSQTQDRNLWRIQPNGNPIGATHDDPYTTYGLNPEMTTLSRFWWRGSRNPDRIVLYHSDTDVNQDAAPLNFNAWWTANSTRGLYLQRATGAPGVDVGGPSVSGGGWATWNSLTNTEQVWCRANLADGNRFLLVIA